MGNVNQGKNHLMQKYRDSNGEIVEAVQVDGPTLLNTIEGEKCGVASDFVIILPNGKSVILNEETFNASFIKEGE